MAEHPPRLPYEGQDAFGLPVKMSTIRADRSGRRCIENGGEHGSVRMIPLHVVEDTG